MWLENDSLPAGTLAGSGLPSTLDVVHMSAGHVLLDNRPPGSPVLPHVSPSPSPRLLSQPASMAVTWAKPASHITPQWRGAVSLNETYMHDTPEQDANARLIPRAIRICGHPGGPRLQLCYARLRETGISGREGRGRHMRASTHTHTHLTHRHRYTRTERAGKMEQEARGKRQKVHRLVGAADAVRRRRQDAVPGLCYGGAVGGRNG